MVTVVGATMPTGGVTIGATPPAQHVPQEAGQPPAQTAATTATPKRSGENRRVSVCYQHLDETRRKFSPTALYSLKFLRNPKRYLEKLEKGENTEKVVTIIRLS